MAINFVGTGNFASGTGAISVPFPSSYSDNDIALLFVESANQGIATPSGWTLAGNAFGAGTPATAGGVLLSVFYKIISGSQSNVSVADSGDHTTGRIAVFSGIDTFSPIGATSGSVQSTASASWTLPGVTTTQENSADRKSTRLNSSH